MTPVHPATQALHARVRAQLPFDDDQDFQDARRGFVGTLPDAHIAADAGGVAWSMRPYAFLEGEAAASVNPSLWRLAQLNSLHGLFEVCEGIYQVRGFSLANVTFVEGETGVIVIDPLTFTESARAALALYRKHRGERPVTAVVYTHCHRDHYGGVRGVVTPEEARRQNLPVFAPNGFSEEAFSETIMAGVAMRRRSLFQFGSSLPPGPEGHVDSGLGKAVGRGGDGFVPPTRLICAAQETHRVDGVTITFQLTPGTEAPAEMNLFFPDHRALNLAENASRTMHNLCPPRGAKIRDSLAWARYLDAALDEFVPRSDVVMTQHHWPVWGQARVAAFVTLQRDLYRYLHDQTLRHIAHGLTAAEISAALVLPEALDKAWCNRPYYGAVPHNVAAIYAHYLGPYDGNPVHLAPLPQEEAARRYVRYMGGADAVVARAREDYAAGDFQWVIEVLHHVIFAEPSHEAARNLSADAMEQLGFQAESSTLRNSYLLAARELRQPVKAAVPAAITISPDVLGLLPLGLFLDYLAVRLNGPVAQHLAARLDWRLGEEETCRLTLSNGALHHRPGAFGASADARVSCERALLGQLLLSPARMQEAFHSGALQVDGNRDLFGAFLDALDDFDPMFAIVTP